jgi:hypothetical protein
MGFFYFDESIHPIGGFSLGAYVYSDTSLDCAVSDALRQCGLTPKKDEFKSGARKDGFPQQVRLRELLRGIVQDSCGIGVVIAPDSPREILGREALPALNKILSTTRFKSHEHTVFFDQGIFSNVAARQRAAEAFRFAQPCELRFEQDSRTIFGLQVADYVAHTSSTMLLGQLGLIVKTVKAGENSGYNPDLDIEIAFEMWAALRYSFFSDPPPPVDTWKTQLDWKVDVAARGLHVSDLCKPTLSKAAFETFGEIYLGCIH